MENAGKCGICSHLLGCCLPGLGVSPEFQLRGPTGSWASPEFGRAVQERSGESFWSALGSRWLQRAQNQTNISCGSKGQHRNLQNSILWHQGAGAVTAGTIPELAAATLSLIILQGKNGGVKSLSLQRVRNNPPPSLQGKGKKPQVYLDL